MSEIVEGSIKNKITATELVNERANCDFDQEELARTFWGGEDTLKLMRKYEKDY